MEIQIAQIIFALFYFFYYLIEAIKNWWWFFVPFVLWWAFVKTYLYWLQENWWDKNISKAFFEIKLPPDVLKPLKAMEQTLNCFWGILYDPANWKEKWFQGKDDCPLSLEVVSIDGRPHFYMSMDRSFKQSIDGCIYGQFPDAEIVEVDDYTKLIPESAPNKDWDLFGADLVFTSKKDFFPIKTLSKFFEPSEGLKEEKRLDPLASLLEAMATQTRKGEHIWVQLNFYSVTDTESNFFTDAKKFIDKLAKRPNNGKTRTIIKRVFDAFAFGKQPIDEAPKSDRFVMPEMELTPGEKDVLRAVEEKTSKLIFKCNFRIIYLGEKDVFFKPQIRIPFSFASQFAIPNMNCFLPFKPTFTKIVYFMKKRRIFERKRALIRRYRNRQFSLTPYSGGTLYLNSEEIASIFHFPSKSVAPGPYIPRVQSRKAEVPPEVPFE